MRTKRRPVAGPWARIMLGMLGVAGGVRATGASPADGPGAATAVETESASGQDPFLWLEEVEGERALAWARTQNEQSVAELEAHPGFSAMQERFLAILDSDERIPTGSKRGDWVYNFWRDKEHPRGLWRRSPFDAYRAATPAWSTVLDLDRLADEEGENWVWKGSETLYPDYDRSLVNLSRGGADAKVVREFDVEAGVFVKDGFRLPEAKSRVTWRDRDHLYVATDFGPGSMSTSGYPILVKEWTRGTPLAEARTVFEGQAEDVGVTPTVVHDRGCVYEFITRRTTFWTNEAFLRRDNDWVRIPKPDDAEFRTFEDWLLLELRSDWTTGGKTFPAGALVGMPVSGDLENPERIDVLFAPTKTSSLAGVSGTRNFLILNILDNVRNRLERLRLSDGGWKREAIPVSGLATVSAWGVDAHTSDDFWMTRTDFLTPSSLWLGTIGDPEPKQIFQLPAFFRAEGLDVAQHFAASRDGTKIPYFQVQREGLKPTGDHPTLLYGYGGFEIPLVPRYSAVAGSGWLEPGGVYVIANIRGGGEFGPRWHQAALKENRQRAYDDFIAVAEDLIRRGVTSPRHLGIRGGSNGGLLVGNILVQRPDLLGAVVCQVPLLDMRRFHRLLAGASWVGEYGDPDDPEQWAFLRRYSPYQRVRAETRYPRTLFTTSTRDDRVHPAHARKMVARMKSQGHDVLYYENIEGGHGGAANNAQRAYMAALVYAFLWEELR